MTSSKVKIGLLLATHIVCGVVLLCVSRPMNSLYCFLVLKALEDADAALLGIWAGLSTARLGWRLIAVVGATVYMLVDYGLFRYATFSLFDQEWTLYWYLMVPVATFGILSALRLSRRNVHLVHLANALPLLKTDQFTIRHVLWATAVVASALGLGRAIRSLTEGDSDYWWAIVLDPPCATLAPLALLWATLGLGRLPLRLAFGFPMAVVVMLIPELLHYDNGISQDSIIFIGLDAIIIIASLLVFRSCGWRVVSRGGVEADRQVRSDDQGSATAGALGTT